MTGRLFVWLRGVIEVLARGLKPTFKSGRDPGCSHCKV